MHLNELGTERRNRATENLDTMTTLELVTAMNREDTVGATRHQTGTAGRSPRPWT